MKKIILSSAIFGLLFFTACEDDNEVVDVTAPTITLSEPGTGEAFDAGDAVHFEALFEDDIALATYSINIHDNFDGHSHGRLAATSFEYSQSFDLSGTSDDVHEDIDIPSDAFAGPYHMVVEAIDAAGNSTTFADGSSIETEIWIHNDEMAHVHFEDETGAEVDEYEGVVDEPLQFYGEVEDQAGNLDHVLIMVGHLEEGGEHDDHDHGRMAEDDHVFEEEFEVEGQASVALEDLLDGANIVVTQSDLDELEEGEHLYLIVRVEDEAGNISRYSIEIHFD